jgi:hypothetical protein
MYIQCGQTEHVKACVYTVKIYHQIPFILYMCTCFKLGDQWIHPWFVGDQWIHPWFVGEQWIHPWFVGEQWIHPWFVGEQWFHHWFAD